MRCSLCDKDRALYPLVYRSDEMKVANALQGMTPLRACESCWMTETTKMPQDEMLDVLLGTLIDAETSEEKLKELDEKYDELKKDFSDLEDKHAELREECDGKVSEKDRDRDVEEARKEGQREGYDEGYAAAEAEFEQQAEASERRAAVEDMP